MCRVMDYGKWLYEQKQKYRQGRKKTQLHRGTLKEIRLRPETDKHDLDIKTKRGREFLEKGHKVQFSILFRGRQMLHQEKGYEILRYIAEIMDDIAKVEQNAKMSHRRMTMLLISK